MSKTQGMLILFAPASALARMMATTTVTIIRAAMMTATHSSDRAPVSSRRS
jgi:hypothetical protein